MKRLVNRLIDNMRTDSARRVLCALLANFLALACVAPVGARTEADSDAQEPTVSRKEAELLEQSAAVAETNLNAAASMLAAEDASQSSAAVDFTLGNLYFQAERFDAAEEAYRRALDKLPRFRRARMNLGRIYLLQDRGADAVKVLKDLALFGQADADGFILLGHALAVRQHSVSSENAYRQALLLEPGNTDAMLGLVRSLMLQERYREGVHLLAELLEQEPERRELWSLAASARLALQENDKALTALESARRLGAADAAMLASLGELYLNAGQPDEAAAVFYALVEDASPPAARILRAAEAFMAAGDLEHSGEMLSRMETRQDGSPGSLTPEQNIKLLRLKGNLARLRGEHETAVEIYTRILKTDPLDARTLLMLGDIHRESGALEEAVMSYERAARISGSEADALVRQAQVEVERARYARAVELLETAQAFEDRPNVARYLEQVRRLAQ